VWLRESDSWQDPTYPGAFAALAFVGQWSCREGVRAGAAAGSCLMA